MSLPKKSLILIAASVGLMLAGCSFQDSEQSASSHQYQWQLGFSEGYQVGQSQVAPRSVAIDGAQSTEITPASLVQSLDADLETQVDANTEKIDYLAGEISDLKEKCSAPEVSLKPQQSKASTPDCDCGPDCSCKSATASVPASASPPPVAFSAPSGSSGNVIYSSPIVASPIITSYSSSSYPSGDSSGNYSTYQQQSVFSSYQSPPTSTPTRSVTRTVRVPMQQTKTIELAPTSQTYAAPRSRFGSFMQAPLRGTASRLLGKCDQFGR